MGRGSRSGAARAAITPAAPKSPAGHNIQAVVAVFVDDREELHRHAAGRDIEDDVDAPHVSLTATDFTFASGRGGSFGRRSWPGDLQPLTATDPLHGPQGATAGPRLSSTAWTRRYPHRGCWTSEGCATLRRTRSASPCGS